MADLRTGQNATGDRSRGTARLSPQSSGTLRGESRLFLIVMLACIAGLGGFLLWRHGSRDTLAQARRNGVLRIGYAVEAPYALLTPEGEVTGESPEIARLIAQRLGISHVEWRLTEFGSLLDGLEARRFDVVAAGMFITPERAQRVAFSAPTFQVAAALLVRKGNPHALHAYRDLVQTTNVRIAVLNGSAEETRLCQLGLPVERLVRVPDALSGRVAVRAGQADGLVLSAPAIRWMMRHPIAGQTEMAEPFEASSENLLPSLSQGAFAFRKADRALCRAWNAELIHFIGSEEHRRLMDRFGFSHSELPLASTNQPNASP